MSIERSIHAILALLAVSSVAPTSYAQGQWVGYWTDWTSEESGAVWCNAWNEAAIGFACSGSYCDNVALLCNQLPNGISLDTSTDYWTGWFSEETDDYVTFRSGWYNSDVRNQEVCHWGTSTPGLMSGIDCSGSYCDSISLECTVPKRPNGTLPTFSNCAWSSSWFSEEQGAVAFGSQSFIAGAKCSGSYCDNKKFYVCVVN